MKDSNKGQTLVEILLAVGVASLALVALTRAMTSSLRNARFAQDKVLAVQYSQESLEAIRSYRDQNNWSVFSNEANCENAGLTGLPAMSAGFSRTVDCATSGTVVTVTVTVSWDSGNHQTELVSYFSQWQ